MITIQKSMRTAIAEYFQKDGSTLGKLAIAAGFPHSTLYRFYHKQRDLTLERASQITDALQCELIFITKNKFCTYLEAPQEGKDETIEVSLAYFLPFTHGCVSWMNRRNCIFSRDAAFVTERNRRASRLHGNVCLHADQLIGGDKHDGMIGMAVHRP